MIKHGHSTSGANSGTYSSYYGMKSRCYDKNLPKYKNHGGRGIKVCDRWLGENGFLNFLEDMGERPPCMTIERIDNDGNYAPDNCKWATYIEQNNNTRFNKLLSYNNETHTLAEWGRKLGIDRRTINARLMCDWPVEKALSTPSAHKNNLIEYNKKRMTLLGWSEELGIGYSTLWFRLFENHWSIERAFTTPVRRSPHANICSRSI
jgi:hypothetical protein